MCERDASGGKGATAPLDPLSGGHDAPRTPSEPTRTCSRRRWPRRTGACKKERPLRRKNAPPPLRDMPSIRRAQSPPATSPQQPPSSPPEAFRCRPARSTPPRTIRTNIPSTGNHPTPTGRPGGEPCRKSAAFRCGAPPGRCAGVWGEALPPAGAGQRPARRRRSFFASPPPRLAPVPYLPAAGGLPVPAFAFRQKSLC